MTERVTFYSQTCGPSVLMSLRRTWLGTRFGAVYRPAGLEYKLALIREEES